MDEQNTKELLAQMDPGLRVALEKLHTAIQQSPLKKEVEEFKNIISKKPPPPEQLVFSFIPHQLAKTSIFFPMSDRELKEENRKINKLEHETSWGKITVEGVKLAIFEEDILLAILHIIKDKTKKEKDGYVSKTLMPEIAKILYHGKSYTKNTYERINKALEHFELVRFEILVRYWKKKGKERIRIDKEISMAGILSGHTYDRNTQELTIYWNNRFFAYFLESMLTNINLTIRRKLKKDGSKALLRFLSTHTDPGRMNIFIVLNAINYNINQPLYELRRKLKSFVSELKKQGVLGKNTKMFKDDTIYFDIIKKSRYLP